jgi:cytoskeleton protein RodZ
MFEIGPALQEARERRGLAYSQVEAATAIRSRYLRALEEEQFGILPGPTYTKGFLRAYAEYLGLDGQLFVDEFNSRHHDPRRDLEQTIYSRPRSQPDRPRRRQRREATLVMVVLAAIVAVSALILLGLTEPNRAQPVPPTLPTTNAPTAPLTGTVPDTSGPPATHQTAAKARFSTTFTATNRCWLVVRIGSPSGPAAVSTHGTPLGGYTLDPAVDGSVTVRSRRPLYVSQLGAPSSLTVTIDGHARPLPAGTDATSVLRVTRTGITQA